VWRKEGPEGMYRIHQIKLNWDAPQKEIPEKIRKKLGFSEKELGIVDWFIRKESIDARDKNHILRVYTVNFQVFEPKALEDNPLVEKVVPLHWEMPSLGEEILKNPPVVVGFGPAGMFAGLVLAEAGFQPLILERGSVMEERIHKVHGFWSDGVLDEETNVQFGEGGAGTFSDGKLTTGIRDVRIEKVLKELVEAGANPDIQYKQKPHIGTDILRKVVVGIRHKIIALGGRFRFDTKMTDIVTAAEGLTKIFLEPEEAIPVEALVLAIGHSARDTLEMLWRRELVLEQKPFSMGVRVEHPQELINRSQYGKTLPTSLGPADYKLVYRGASGRGVYTFCMCPGGQVILACSEANTIVTNGMSNRDRSSGKANSALLVEVHPADFPSSHPLAGMWLQRKVEKEAFRAGGSRYTHLICTMEEFLESKGMGNRIRCCFPDFIGDHLVEAIPFMGKKIRGFDGPEGMVYGVETRSSSPVRICRDDSYQSNIRGVYPTGEGAGYAGGIVSAAVDGIRVAEQLINRYQRRTEHA
jgi:hypothetical protein